MKIIKDGNPKKKPFRDDNPNWWIGLQHTCDNCGQIIKLENSDKSIITRILCFYQPVITFHCANCRTQQELKKNSKHLLKRNK